jgi:hypothetical protein
MVIANRLRDGLTVFLTAGGTWVESIEHGAVARSDAEAAQLLETGELDAARNLVVAPYLIEIAEGGGERRPLAWREFIRAYGPTVRTGPTA